jgi:KipI family sensor histidine kinase inhibitor
VASILGYPTIVPLGDCGLLVRFGSTLSDAANLAALGFARRLADKSPGGVTEIVPNLVSVLLTYDPARIGFEQLAGEVRLLAGVEAVGDSASGRRQALSVTFDGDDLAEVAGTLGLSAAGFIAAHNAAPLRVLAVGFAPGFVYCGFHPEALMVPRRAAVRPSVPAGTVLFAAGQTAIAGTTVPTGWHVIGHTEFRNFDPTEEPPTRLSAGDEILFEAVT